MSLITSGHFYLGDTGHYYFALRIADFTRQTVFSALLFTYLDEHTEFSMMKTLTIGLFMLALSTSVFAAKTPPLAGRTILVIGESHMSVNSYLISLLSG